MVQRIDPQTNSFLYPHSGQHVAEYSTERPNEGLLVVNSLPLNAASYYHKIVCIDGHWVYLSGMKILNREGKIEFVIVASFKHDLLALTKYKDRWQTETMFKAFKSGGNIQKQKCASH